MLKRFSFLKISLPMQLLIIVAGTFLLGHLIPLAYKSFFYTVSTQLQEVLVFVLPFIVFSYIFACLVSFENNVVLFLLTLLILVVLSNGLSSLYAYGVGKFCFSYATSIQPVTSQVEPLKAMEIFTFYKVSNLYALLSGTILGLIFFYFRYPRVVKLAESLKAAANFFLRSIFIPLIPLFIFGFMLKMEHDGILSQALTSYAPIVVIAVVAQALYISGMFMIAAHFKFGSWATYIKNAFPSMVTAFTTMSSSITMPLVLQGAEKSSKYPKVVQACVPATINIHTVGDSITLPLLIMATLLTFGHPFPSFETYLTFTGYYVLQKFAGATVPGGGVMLAMPILQGLFGFDPTMQGFITAIYMLFDPFLTVGNVTGNGAFAIFFAHLFSKHAPAKVAPTKDER